MYFYILTAMIVSTLSIFTLLFLWSTSPSKKATVQVSIDGKSKSYELESIYLGKNYISGSHYSEDRSVQTNMMFPINSVQCIILGQQKTPPKKKSFFFKSDK